MPRHITPLRQGDLDALCGLYAVINACRLLVPALTVTSCRVLFEDLTRSAFAQARRHGRSSRALTISRGLVFEELTALLRLAQLKIFQQTGARLAAHPLRPDGTCLAALWLSLERSLSARDAVAIAGLAGREAHWTVIAGADAKRLELFDSSGRLHLARTACSVRASSRRVVIDQDEIIVISRTDTLTSFRRVSRGGSDGWRRGAARPARIVSINVAGRVARKPKHTRARLELLETIIAALAAKPSWAPVDAVLLPGGFLWHDRAIGPLPSPLRREALADSLVGAAVHGAARNLERSFPGALLALGIDVAGSAGGAPPEHLVAAFSSDGLAGLAMKAFPAPEDADMGMITHAHDFAAPERFVTLRNGAVAVLGACYDGFGLAFGHPSRAGIARFVTRLRLADRLVAPTSATRELLARAFQAELKAHRPNVALIAVHKIRPGRADGYWQRHGIAMASAALGRALVVGATHYEKLTQWAPHLAAHRVPRRHLDEGFNRRAHRLVPADRIEIRLDGELVAIAVLFSG
jgi:hypothetical protein